MERSEGFGDSVLEVRRGFRLFRLYATTIRSAPKSLISLEKFGSLCLLEVRSNRRKNRG